MPYISIILPVFNAQPYLGMAIDSLLCQTLDDFELIILEDGSTDSSLHYLLTLKDPRIKLFHDGLNRGLTYRLNQGIREAQGKFICRMDADDISLANRLQLQIEFLEANPEIDLVGGRAVAFISPKKILGYLPFANTHEELCAQPWNRIPLPHPTWMARREWYLLHSYSTPEVVRAEDQDLLLQAYPVSKYHCIEEVVLAYRIGSYNYRSSLVARYSLLRTQVITFFNRQQYSYVFLACLVCIVKSIIDLAKCFSSINVLITSRKTTTLEPYIIHSIESLIDRTKESSVFT